MTNDCNGNMPTTSISTLAPNTTTILTTKTLSSTSTSTISPTTLQTNQVTSSFSTRGNTNNASFNNRNDAFRADIEFLNIFLFITIPVYLNLNV